MSQDPGSVAPSKPTTGRGKLNQVLRIPGVNMKQFDEVDFDAPDDESNVYYDNGNLNGAVIWKLVSLITSPTVVLDANFLQDFLLTYSTFMNGNMLLDALIARYNKTTNIENKHIVKLRVLNVLKIWIHKHWGDFEQYYNQESFSTELNQFFERVSQTTEARTVTMIKESLEKKLNNKKPNLEFILPPPATRQLNSNLLTDYTVEQLSHQLALIEWSLWVSVESVEFLDLAWSKKDKHSKCPHLLKIADWFNHVSSLVATTICIKDKKKR
jgi:hypothetical protein